MSEDLIIKPKRKIIVFTVADDNNFKYAEGLKHSFEHFHPNIEFKIYGQGFLDKIKDPEKFYKMTPLIARELIGSYDQVVKIDADSVVTGDLSHVFEDSAFDVASVHNNNNIDPKVTIFNIPPQLYLNCGFVAMNSKRFIDHWWRLCNSPMYGSLPYREQDLLNIMFYYGDYAGINLDSVTDYWHGLISKGFWMQTKLIDDKVFVDIPMPNLKGEETVIRKEIKVIHYAGGQNNFYPGGKMTFSKHFPDDVAKHLHELYQK